SRSRTPSCRCWASRPSRSSSAWPSFSWASSTSRSPEVRRGIKPMSGALQSSLASLHDVELCSYAAAGERRAFGELVRRHGSGVRGLLRRMGAQAAEADDTAQDAFLAAFERIAEFRGEGTFAGWVKK